MLVVNVYACNPKPAHEVREEALTIPKMADPELSTACLVKYELVCFFKIAMTLVLN